MSERQEALWQATSKAKHTLVACRRSDLISLHQTARSTPDPKSLGYARLEAKKCASGFASGTQEAGSAHQYSTFAQWRGRAGGGASGTVDSAPSATKLALREWEVVLRSLPSHCKCLLTSDEHEVGSRQRSGAGQSPRATLSHVLRCSRKVSQTCSLEVV